MAIPILGEKVGIHRGIAVMVGLIGVLIVLRPGAATAYPRPSGGAWRGGHRGA